MNKHYTGLMAMYKNAPVNEVIGLPKMQITEGQCTMDLSYPASFFHAAGSLHGAFYFRLLDDCAYFAAASLETSLFLYTTSFETKLLRPVGTELLHCEAKAKRLSDGVIEATAELFSEGKLAALGKGRFRAGKKKLVDIPNYTHEQSHLS